MPTPKRPQLAALFAAALAAGVIMLVLLAVALAGPQPAHGQPASPLPTPTPVETGWEVISAPDSFFRLRLPPGWYASSGQNVVVIDNYNFHVIDQRPDNGINIHISLGERPFLQTFEQYVAEWQKAESSPSALGPYPTPVPIIPFQPITVGGYTGVSEIIKVEMESGEQWPIQSIILDVEPRWIAGITIKPTSSPDYDQALRIIHTLEIAPRCQEDPDLALYGRNAALRGELETIVARELEARQTANWPAFQSLVHSETDPAWLAQQRYLLGPDWQAIDLTRIEHSGDWALAAVLETHVAGGSSPSQFYTVRAFRQAATGCWQLTSPGREAWFERSDAGIATEGWLQFRPLNITFSPFDEPYVRAAGPRLVLALPQMADDFGIALAENRQYNLRVSPYPDWREPGVTGGVWGPAIQSPLWPGFPLSLAQSPEEYLFGALLDLLGHELLADEFGEAAAEPARLALAHAAVQWEAERATGRDHTLRLAAAAGPRSPLAALLDPQRDPLVEDGTGDGAGNQGERDLFLRFAIAERGRGVIAPYLQAVFHNESTEELVEAVFAEELPVVEKRWRAWLARPGAGS